MKTTLFCLLASACFLFSCNNASKDDYTSPDGLAKVPGTNPNDTLSKKTDSVFNPLLQQADQVISVSPQNTAPVTTTMPTTTTTQPAATKTGLNPEHGKPGHRCDIAVGAPLTTPVTQLKPTNVSPQTITTTTTPIATPVTKTTQKTAAGMNPPHGEPGHRCDISVGAPLNSAPNKTLDKPAIIATDAGVSAPDSTKK